MSNLLIVFAKNPQHSPVKTRIARHCGPQRARQIYDQLLDITFDWLRLCRADVVLYTDALPFPHPKARALPAKLQRGNDLGQRMHNALLEGSTSHSRCILIGVDCPYLNAPLLDSAFQHLSKTPVVIGPSADGGYYLIGVQAQYAYLSALFEDMPWSSHRVFDITMRRLKALSITPHLLPTLSDIDTWDDWQQYLRYHALPKS